jgi:MFS family permease
MTATVLHDRWTLRSILVIVACGVGNIFSVTTVINATFSNFLIPVSTDLGWHRSQFSLVLTLISILGVIAYPLSGRLMDKLGPRPVALVGNVMFGVSVACLSFIPKNPAYVYLLFGVMGLLSTLPSTLLFARVVSTWFYARRGIVLGLSGGLAFGIGGVTVPPIAQMLIQTFGWRGAYIGLGTLVIAVGLPVFFFLLREAPPGIAPPGTAGADTESGLTRAQAQRLPAFWILLGGVALGAGSIAALITHMIPLVAERGGSVTLALAALSMLYAANAVWQIVLGAVLDRRRSPRIAALFILPGALGALLLSFGAGIGTLILGGCLVGLSVGTEYALLPFCIPRYFGFRAYGEIFGWVYGVIVLLQGIAPYLMDIAFEAFGSYRPVILTVAVTLLLCSAAIALLPAYGEVRSRSWGGG